MIVGGLGVGLVNPPLASTAVGVVPPDQAGMASGINSTFRQVGIATGIALLGTLFSSQLRDYIAGHASVLAGHGPQLAAAIQAGGIGSVLQHVPPAARPAVEQLARAAFASGLNTILLVAAIIALAGGNTADGQDKLKRALALNPQFAFPQADEARRGSGVGSIRRRCRRRLWRTGPGRQEAGQTVGAGGTVGHRPRAGEAAAGPVVTLQRDGAAAAVPAAVQRGRGAGVVRHGRFGAAAF